MHIAMNIFFSILLFCPAVFTLPQPLSLLIDRETACVALDKCGGAPASETSTPTPTLALGPAQKRATTCNCNEDGCTDDSPPCCANGSCPPDPSATPESSSFKIGNWAALGDSYASGLKYNFYNGYDGNKDNCRRYRSAYAAQMEEDDGNNGRLGGASHLNFVACSGSHTDRIFADNGQASQIPDQPSLVTVTIGGNDANFYPVLNACIYRADTNLRDKDCDQAIGDSGNIIQNDIPGAISKVLDAILTKSVDDTKVVITGYPHFFNVDTTQCNDVTFSRNNASDPDVAPRVTQDLRKRINALTQNMNDAISKAVSEKGDSRILFLDVSPKFNGHRFCEANIVEPDIDSQQTWLFHLDLKHWLLAANDTANLRVRQEGTPDTTDYVCDADLQGQGDWGALFICDWINSGQTLQTLGVEVGLESGGNPGDWGVVARTFHPTEAGHFNIKQVIYDTIGVK